MAALVCSSCLTITKTPDVNIGKNSRCPKCTEPGKIIAHDGSNDYTGQMVLTSGHAHEFDSVYMVPLDVAQNVQRLYEEAAKKLTPKSTGLGFMGDLGFVVAASLATSVVEGAVNRLTAAGGENLLNQYYQSRLALRYAGKFCSIGSIRQIQFPEPAIWACEQNVAGRSMSFTMLDDPFVLVRTVEGKPITIRWSCVEQYWVALD